MSPKFSFAFMVDSVTFTRDVVDGKTSLGGSESSCVMLTRALSARGHDVHIFTTKIEPDAEGRDSAGVTWHDWQDFLPMNRFVEWDCVVSLRTLQPFVHHVSARYRVLWNQDLMVDGTMQKSIMSVAWGLDRLAYVSAYHRKQWEGIQPELAPIGWTTTNCYDPACVPDPKTVTKDPYRIIHVSRPERGLAPLLAMWPALKAKEPRATLRICRYNSMYDASGWGEVCKQFDERVAEVNAEVGGITYLGELNKTELYRELAEAAVMWYPGVADFAETSCWTPDTPVAVPGGHVAIKDVKPGDLVMSYDETAQKIVAKRVKWCRRTGQNKAVVKLTYKWRHGRKAGRMESILGTPNHQMLRRDGTWSPLSSLAVGDSLMPMFRKSDGKYWEVGHTGSKYRYEHDVVGEAIVGRALLPGEIVHHRNENGLDNQESNLNVWQQSAHIRHHLPEMKAAYAAQHPFDYERAHALRRNGLPQHVIAAQMGTTQATVSRKLASSNHQVVSIEPAGFSDVWDMEVEDTHTFIAGHVVVHNCIAAIESQACGTPMVGSFKGALPETAAPMDMAGFMIDGDALKDRAYHERSISAVLRCLGGAARGARWYRDLQDAGRVHAADFTAARLAESWEAMLDTAFTERRRTQAPGILAQLMREDDHVAGHVLAEQITADYRSELGIPAKPGLPLPTADDHYAPAWYVRAIDAAALCERVIAGKEQGPEDYSDRSMDALEEAKGSGRYRVVVPMFAGCKNVLDVACGNGSFAIALCWANPDVHVYGVDYAIANVEKAKAAAAEAGVADRCHFERATVYDFDAQDIAADYFSWLGTPNRAGPIEAKSFDGAFIGEFLEHVADAKALVDAVEIALQKAAVVVYTTPCGTCTDILPRTVPLKRGHVHRFHREDVQAIFGLKTNLSVDYSSWGPDFGVTPRGLPIGGWIISYRMDAENETGNRDLPERIRRTRPMPRLTVGVIAKNAELELGLCLDSIWAIADEIIVGDCGSSDATAALAAHFGARVLALPPVEAQPEGFAGARNAVLREATGEWFLWIDADERMIRPDQLRKYLDAHIFHGYALHQKHLYLDMPPTYDVPVRLFRRQPSVQFYGCVHEQPQMGDCNGDITPALEPFDVEIAHTGYLTEHTRRHKMLHRNLPLLARDQHVFPDRMLGKVLVLRDYVNLADHDREEHRGAMTEKAQRAYFEAIRLFMAFFDDPANKFHKLARPFYETALRAIGAGWEFEIALAGKEHGLNGSHAGPQRAWVRDRGEMVRLMTYLTKKCAEGMVKTSTDVAPLAKPPVEEDSPADEDAPVTSFEHLVRQEAMSA